MSDILITSNPDYNYFSISNNITNCTGSVGVLIPKSPVFKPDNPKQFASIVKICDKTSNLILNNFSANQGNEGVIDIANGTNNIIINGVFGELGQNGDRVISEKGGCNNTMISGIVKSRGKNYDVIRGSWCDQNYNKATNATYNLIHADGNPVRLVNGWSDKANISSGSNIKVLFWWSLGFKIYYIAKMLLVKVIYPIFPNLNPYNSQ